MESAQFPVMTDDAVLRDELESAIEARKELGDEMEPAVIDAFVARIERRLADHADKGQWALQARREHHPGVIAVCAALAVIAIVSRRG